MGAVFAENWRQAELMHKRTQTSAKELTPPQNRVVRPSTGKLFMVFTMIGLSSFGGGLSGWMMREFVDKKNWLDRDEFLTGLALAQAFPGVNVVNLAIWIGFRLGGGIGALSSACGIVLPPAIMIILLSEVITVLSRYALANHLLTGIVAVAIGLPLSMGVTACRHAARNVSSILIMIAAFAGGLSLPTTLVLLLLGPVSIAIAYFKLSRHG